MKILLIIVIVLLLALIVILLYAAWKIRKVKRKVTTLGTDLLVDASIEASKRVAHHIWPGEGK